MSTIHHRYSPRFEGGFADAAERRSPVRCAEPGGFEPAMTVHTAPVPCGGSDSRRRCSGCGCHGAPEEAFRPSFGTFASTEPQALPAAGAAVALNTRVTAHPRGLRLENGGVTVGNSGHYRGLSDDERNSFA